VGGGGEKDVDSNATQDRLIKKPLGAKKEGVENWLRGHRTKKE